MRISVTPASVSFLTGWKIIGSRPTGSRCLLVTLVSGNRREPVPPARTTPFMRSFRRRHAARRFYPETRRKAKGDARSARAATRVRGGWRRNSGSPEGEGGDGAGEQRRQEPGGPGRQAPRQRGRV